ncbi:hypothetical protein [Romboutsia timonensis]|uniref:hypothetical protein n=1 Tax=Romboutsia timonensis TaxID=1776391 RepID=UPI0023F7C4C8|nr:hypothetical protein [Romboutsia timonensis]
MARTKKCDECRKDCIKENMVQVDYMTKNGNVKTKMYCSEECSNAKETRKKLIEDTNNLLESILEMPIRTNMYFNKLYSPIVSHYGYKAIYDMLHSEYSYICDALNKDFVTPNVKIKYFMAIVQNKIEDYKNTTQTEETEKEANIEIIEIPKVEFKNKTKKSIFDI